MKAVPYVALLSFAAVTTDAGTSSASAQTPGTQELVNSSESATQDSLGIEDIVVTAQRRGERLQDVPIAITALTSESLESAGIRSTDQLPSVTPGLVITQQQTSLQIYLRGVGTQNAGVGEEGSIATYVDGVYYPSLAAAVFGFNNIERVEVLRGPQGTLFGRNATGGLIQVITREPSQDPSLDASIGYTISRRSPGVCTSPVESPTMWPRIFLFILISSMKGSDGT